MLTPATRNTFHTLLDARTFAEPNDAPAIIFVATEAEPVVVTRRELATAVSQHAAAFHALGIQPGDLVLIAHTQNLESIYAFWGALWLGAIPTLFPSLTEKLDADVYRRNMAQLIALSQVKAVLTSDDFAATLRDVASCTVFGSSDLPLDAPSPTFSAPDPDSIAFLQHSSGTTGLQKGVALTHTAVLNQLAAYSEAIALHADDVVVSWLPLYHDMGLIAGFLLPLVQGVPLVLLSPFDWVQHPALLLQAIDRYQGTLCWLPNFAYNHCARRIRRRDKEAVSLASIRLFINCSEPVRQSSHQLFLDAFAAQGVTPDMLGVSYAMAENTFAVTQTPPGQSANLDWINGRILAEQKLAEPVDPTHPEAAPLVSCGRPILGTAVTIVDEQGEPLPLRRVGEIVVRSDCMLTGYYKRDDLRPFRNGWYHTGDRGYLADGELYVIGRSKDLIINAGKNIYPQDIEAVVNEVPGVYPGRAVVFGVPDEREGTELIAVVAEVETADPEQQNQIRLAIRQAVGVGTAVSVSFVTLVPRHWLLKTSSGKIARAENRRKWLAEKSNH
ncbi:MAG: AMP-binding protein [Ardenticatenaceae bacterium]|nr:AMP-binding protein [Ardenticatenaceae bacterium]